MANPKIHWEMATTEKICVGKGWILSAIFSNVLIPLKTLIKKVYITPDESNPSYFGGTSLAISGSALIVPCGTSILDHFGGTSLAISGSALSTTAAFGCGFGWG